MFKLEINEKKYNVPESFDELKLSQYCDCFYNIKSVEAEMDEKERRELAIKNSVIILSRLLGEKDDFLETVPVTIYSKLSEICKYIFETSERFLDNSSSKVKIDGDIYQIPEPSEMTLRQFIDAESVLEEDGNEQYIRMLAVLLSKRVKGGYEPYTGEFEKMIPKIANLSCTEALPLVYHHLKKKIVSQRITEVYSTIQQNQLARLTKSS